MAKPPKKDNKKPSIAEQILGPSGTGSKPNFGPAKGGNMHSQTHGTGPLKIRRSAKGR